MHLILQIAYNSSSELGYSERITCTNTPIQNAKQNQNLNNKLFYQTNHPPPHFSCSVNILLLTIITIIIGIINSNMLYIFYYYCCFFLYFFVCALYIIEYQSLKFTSFIQTVVVFVFFFVLFHEPITTLPL